MMTCASRAVKICFAAVALTLLSQVPAQALVRTWTGADGAWNVPGNWSGGVVCAAPNTADIASASPRTVSVTAAQTANLTLLGKASGADARLILSGGGTLTSGDIRIGNAIGSQGTLRLEGGSLGGNVVLRLGYLGSGTLDLNDNNINLGTSINASILTIHGTIGASGVLIRGPTSAGRFTTAQLQALYTADITTASGDTVTHRLYIANGSKVTLGANLTMSSTTATVDFNQGPVSQSSATLDLAGNTLEVAPAANRATGAGILDFGQNNINRAHNLIKNGGAYKVGRLNMYGEGATLDFSANDEIGRYLYIGEGTALTLTAPMNLNNTTGYLLVGNPSTTVAAPGTLDVNGQTFTTATLDVNSASSLTTVSGTTIKRRINVLTGSTLTLGGSTTLDGVAAALVYVGNNTTPSSTLDLGGNDLVVGTGTGQLILGSVNTTPANVLVKGGGAVTAADLIVYGNGTAFTYEGSDSFTRTVTIGEGSTLTLSKPLVLTLATGLVQVGVDNTGITTPVAANPGTLDTAGGTHRIVTGTLDVRQGSVVELAASSTVDRHMIVQGAATGEGSYVKLYGNLAVQPAVGTGAGSVDVGWSYAVSSTLDLNGNTLTVGRGKGSHLRLGLNSSNQGHTLAKNGGAYAVADLNVYGATTVVDFSGSDAVTNALRVGRGATVTLNKNLDTDGSGGPIGFVGLGDSSVVGNYPGIVTRTSGTIKTATLDVRNFSTLTLGAGDSVTRAVPYVINGAQLTVNGADVVATAGNTTVDFTVAGGAQDTMLRVKGGSTVKTYAGTARTVAIGALAGTGTNRTYVVLGDETSTGGLGVDGASAVANVLSVQANGVLMGRGTVDLGTGTATLNLNGQVRADGFGVEDELRIGTGAPATIGSATAGTTPLHGQYAVRKSKLTLPRLALTATTKGWGENDADTDPPDRVNAVRIALSATGGSIDLSLLDPTRSDVPDGLNYPVGVWQFGTALGSPGTATLKFKYDQLEVNRLGVPTESGLKVFQYSGSGPWTDVSSASIDTANDIITSTSGRTMSDSFFAVAYSADAGGTAQELDLYYVNTTNQIPDDYTTYTATRGTDFGTVALSGTIDRTYTITNSAPFGGSDLNLTGPNPVSVSGSPDITVQSQPADLVLSPGEFTSFTIRYTANNAGTALATVSIASDDSNENPFNFNVKAAEVNSSNVVFVDSTAGGLNNGTSWDNAYTSLRVALLSNTNKEVWVANTATYTPGTAVGDSFQLRNNAMYGGFAGTESARGARSILPASRTVLSGNMAGTFAKNVITKSGVLYTGTNVLDGFVVRDGKTAAVATEHGAGLLVTTGALYVANCSFVTNYCRSGNGGAIFASVKNGFLSVSNSVFGHNRTAALAGGAIYAAAALRPLELYGVTFQTNRAATTGGDINVEATRFTQPVLVFDARVLESQAVQSGGSMYLASAQEHRIGGSVFDTVRVTGAGAYLGGAIYSINATALRLETNSFTSCGIPSGTGATYGGAVYHANGTLLVDSCEFLNSVMPAAAGNSGAIFSASTGAGMTVTNSYFSGLTAYGSGGAINLNAAPTGPVLFGGNVFTNCTITYTGSGVPGGGAVYITGSATQPVMFEKNIFGSIRAGNTSATTTMDGGAVFIGTSSSAVITNSVFKYIVKPNYGGGGALRVSSAGQVDIGGCEFLSVTNWGGATVTTGYGGAVYVAGGTQVNMKSLRLTDAVAGNTGGAIYSTAAGSHLFKHLSITNATIAHTTGGSMAGSMLAVSRSGLGFTTTIDGCNFDLSVRPTAGTLDYGAVYVSGSGDITVANSRFSRIYKPNNGAGAALHLSTRANTYGVTLSNLRFASITNNLGSGGAVYVTAAATIDMSSCRFEDVSTTGSGGGFYSDANASLLMNGCTFTNTTITGTAAIRYGGAVYHAGGNALRTFQIQNCVFDRIVRAGSGTTDHGGAVFLQGSGDLTIANTIFRRIWKNNQGIGGGIYINNYNSPITIQNSDFYSITNRLGTGGAVYIAGGGSAGNPVTVTDCRFWDIEQGVAGALGSVATSDHTLTRVSFTNVNSTAANAYAGALYLGGGGTGFTRTLSNIDVYSVTNRTGTGAGGAIRLETATADVSVNHLRISKVYKAGTGTGGAMYLSLAGSRALTIQNTHIHSVTNGAGGGGAIYIAAAGTVDISSTTIDTITSGNGATASSGGAIYSAASGLFKADGIFVTNIVVNHSGTAGNSQGGAIFQSGAASTIQLLNSTIDGVTAGVVGMTGTVDGGGAFLSGTTITVNNMLFKNILKSNRGYGGALNVASTGRAQILSSTIDNANTGNGEGAAVDYGGGIYASGTGGTLDVNNVVLRNLRSDRYGGAIAAANTGPKNLVGVTITNVTMETTGAATVLPQGGAIYVSGAGASWLENVDIGGINNLHGQALGSIDGGAVFITGATRITVTNSVFRHIFKNGRRGYGGALYFNANTPASMVLSDSTIDIASTGDGLTQQVGDGGGLYVTGTGTLDVNNTRIERTSADRYGGAIAADGAGVRRFANLTVTNVLLNAATARLAIGGGLYVAGAGANPVIIRDSIFGGIMAGPLTTSTIDGGAIYVNNTTGGILLSNTVMRQIIKANKAQATGGGGGARLVTTGPLRVYDSRFENIQGTTGTDATTLGGGLKIETANLVVITNSVFTNITAGVGGAIYSTVAANQHLIADSTIADCAAQGTGADGGGIHLSGATVLLKSIRNSIKSCSAPDLGGAIYLAGYPLTGSEMINTVLGGNTAGTAGGGLYILTGNAAARMRLSHVTIAGNAATTGAGGGLNIVGNAAAIYWITNSIVYHNTSGSGASQGALSAGTLSVYDTFAPLGGFTGATLADSGNRAYTDDPQLADLGGLDLSITSASPAKHSVPDEPDPLATPDILGETRPQGPTEDAGAYEFAALVAEPNVKLWGNDTPITSGDKTPDLADHTDFGSTALGTWVQRTYMITNFGDANLTLGSPPVALSAGSTNFVIRTQPPNAHVLLPGEATNFYVRFYANSAGVSTNTVNVASDDPDTPVFSFVIKGTETDTANVVFVDQWAAGSNNGLSWSNAFTSLSSALNVGDSAEIWMARGTYSPGGAAGSTYALKNHRIYGGFLGYTNGGVENLRSQRVVTRRPVLDGGGVNNTVLTKAVSFTGTAVLDALVIEDGAGGAAGTGLKVDHGSVNIANTIFTNNIASATGSGGAIYFASSGGSLAVTNSSFGGNRAGATSGSGGAIYVTTATQPVVLDGIRFHSNEAKTSGSGGDLYVAAIGARDVVVRNMSTVGARAAGGAGGSIYALNTGAFVVSNALFQSTVSTLATASGLGGAIYQSGASSFAMVNSTSRYSRLLGTGGGGSVYATAAASQPVRFDSVVFEFVTNNLAASGGAIHLAGTGGGAAVTVTNCVFRNIDVLAGAAYGAGIYSTRTGAHSVRNSSFDAMQLQGAAASMGAAAYLSAPASSTFKDTDFGRLVIPTGAAGSVGGAVVTATGAATFERCDFSNIYKASTGAGAAIAATLAANPFWLEGCTFLNVTNVGGSGGAIRIVSGAGSVTVTNTVFDGLSTPAGSGAAVYSSGTGAHKYSRLTVTNLTATTAGAGLAIYQDAAHTGTEISDSSFRRLVTTTGTANNHGGAVYNSLGGAFTIDRCVFESIYKANTGVGGAVYAAASVGTPLFRLSNSTFTSVTNASTGGGGAVYVATTFGSVDIANCRFTDVATGWPSPVANGGAGGAINSSANASFVLTGSSFTNVTIHGAANNTYGGAVYHYGGNAARSILVDNCSFDRIVRSTAGTGAAGGALFLQGSADVTVTDTAFRRIWKANTGNGGAAYVNSYSYPVAVQRCVFESITNQLGNVGGLYLAYVSGAGSPVDIADCRFTDIRHESAGAFGSDARGSHTLSAVSFTNVSAAAIGSAGGAVYLNGGGATWLHTLLNVDINTVTNGNSAALTGAGGAVYISGTADVAAANLRISQVRKLGTGAGGAIYLNLLGSRTAALSGMNIANINNAGGEGGAIYIAAAGTVDIQSSTLDTVTAGSNGGGIRTLGTGPLNIDTVTFTNILLNVSTAVNRGGGGLYAAPAAAQAQPVSILNSVFGGITAGTAATATIDGGGAYIANMNGGILVSNTWFQTIVRTAKGVGGGGGLRVAGGTGVLRVDASRFENITSDSTADATGIGGGLSIALGPSSIVITNSVFTNIVSDAGAAIYSAATTAHTVVDTDIQNVSAGTAAIGGGALYHAAAASSSRIDARAGSSTIDVFTGSAIDAGVAQPLRLGGEANQVIAGTIDTAISVLTKDGTGSVTLAAGSTHTYTGSTDIQAGSLVVNGTLPSGSLVLVKDGAALRGTGSMGTVQVLNTGLGGTVDAGVAGASPGATLTAAQMSFADGAALIVNCASGTADLIDVTAASGLTLPASGTLNVHIKNQAGGDFQTEGTYRIIKYNTSYNNNVATLVRVGGASTKTFTFQDDTVNDYIVLQISGGAKTWKGNGGVGTADWDYDAGSGVNWDPVGVPSALSALVFEGPDKLSNNNNLTANTQFGSITFPPTAGAFVIGGNAINLLDNVVNNSANEQTFNLDLVVDSGSRTFATASGDITIGGVVSATAASLNVIKTGAFTLTLEDANTFAGTLDIQAGTVDIGGATAAGSVAGPIANGGVLVISRTTDWAPAGAISGAGMLRKTGDATLTLGVANTHTGTTDIQAGRIVVGDATGLGAAASAVTVVGAGGTLDLQVASVNEALDLSGGYVINSSGTAASQITSGITLSANSYAGGDGAGNLSFGGTITGAGNLTKVGTGTLTLANGNNYTGKTAIDGGTVSIGAATGLGSAPGGAVADQLSLGGGSLATTATLALGATRGVTLNAGGGTFVPSAATTATIDAIITGPGALTLSGSGILRLANGGNDYAGNTTVSSGTLDVGANNAIPDGAGAGNVTVNGALRLGVGTLETINALSGSGTVDNSAAVRSVLSVGGNDQSSTFAGRLTDTAGTLDITKVGTGLLTLTGAANDNAGTLTISAGTVDIGGGATGNYGNNAAPIVDNGVLVFNRSDATLTYSGAISGTGSLSKQGGGAVVLQTGVISIAGTVTVEAGTLDLRAVNTYSGNTIVNADAALRLGGNNVIPNSTGKGDVVLNGLLITGAGTVDTINGLSGSGTVDNQAATTTVLTIGDNTATSQFDGVFQDTSGTLAITKTGAGTVTLTGANDQAGLTTVSVGSLNIQNALALGATTARTIVSSGATLEVQGGITVSGETVDIAGAGLVSGAVRNVSGANVWEGVVNQTLAATITSAGGSLTLDPTSGNAVTGNFILTLNADGGSLAVNEPIATGNNKVSKTGAGLLTYNAANTYTGTTDIQAGTLRLGVAGALVNTTDISVTGTLDLNGNSLTVDGFDGGAAGRVTSSAAGTLTLTAGNANQASATFAGVIEDGSATVALTKLGTGALTLSGANTFDGDLTLSAGRLNIGNASALGSGAGTFNIAASTTVDATAGGITVTSDNPVTVNGSFVFTGTGTLDLGDGAVTLTATPTITTTASTLTIPGAIGDGVGTYGLTKAGASGTLVLSGNSSYEGQTTVSTGILVARSNSALGDTDNGTTVSATGAALYLQNGITITGEALTLAGTGVSSLGALRNDSGNNTWAGNVTLSAATTITTPNAGETLTISGTLDTGSATLTVGSATEGAGLTRLTGKIVGTGGLSMVGTGTLDLPNGTSDFSGGVTLRRGTTIVTTLANAGVASSLGAGTGATGTIDFDQVGEPRTLRFVGATGAPQSTNRKLYLDATGGIPLTLEAEGVSAADTLTFTDTVVATGSSTLDLSGSNTGANTLAGSVSGATMKIVKSGNGLWVLSGPANTYGGGTTVSAGTLRIANSTGSGTGTGAVAVNGGTLDGTGILSGAVTVNVGAVISSGSGAGVVGTIQVGALALNNGVFKADFGATAADPYDRIVSSTLDLSTGTGTIDVQGFDQVGNYRMIQYTTMGGTLDGSSLVVGNADPGYDYELSIEAGTPSYIKLSIMPLAVGAKTWTGPTGGNWSLGANWSPVGAPATDDGYQLVFGSNGGLIHNNIASLNPIGLLFNSGAPAFTLADNAVTVQGHIVNNSAAGQTIDMDVTLTGSWNLNTAAGAITISGDLGPTTGRDDIGFTKLGPATLTLSGNNTYKGVVSISAGTVDVASANGLGLAPDSYTAGRVMIGDAVLKASANVTLGSTMGLRAGGTAASTIDVGANATLTAQGTIDGSAKLIKVGAGTLDIQGASSRTGTTDIQGGVLKINSANGLGTGALVVSDGGALELSAVSLGKAVTITGNGPDAGGAIRDIHTTDPTSSISTITPAGAARVVQMAAVDASIPAGSTLTATMRPNYPTGWVTTTTVSGDGTLVYEGCVNAPAIPTEPSYHTFNNDYIMDAGNGFVHVKSGKWGFSPGTVDVRGGMMWVGRRTAINQNDENLDYNLYMILSGGTVDLHTAIGFQPATGDSGYQRLKGLRLAGENSLLTGIWDYRLGQFENGTIDLQSGSIRNVTVENWSAGGIVKTTTGLVTITNSFVSADYNASLQGGMVRLSGPLAWLSATTVDIQSGATVAGYGGIYGSRVVLAGTLDVGLTGHPGGMLDVSGTADLQATSVMKFDLSSDSVTGTMLNDQIRFSNGSVVPNVTAGARVLLSPTLPLKLGTYDLMNLGPNPMTDIASSLTVDTASSPVLAYTLQDRTIGTMDWVSVAVTPGTGKTLTLAMNPAFGGGSIDPASGTWLYESGSTMSVTATPTGSYIFQSWSGDITGCAIVGGTISGTMDVNRAITAHFVIPDVKVYGGSPQLFIASPDVTPAGADSTYYGNVTVGQPVTHTFTVKNDDSGSHTVSASVSGTAFSVTQPTSPLAGSGATTTFTVTFNPAAAGTYSETVTVANSDNGNYQFTVAGTATEDVPMVYSTQNSGTDFKEDFEQSTAGVSVLASGNHTQPNPGLWVQHLANTPPGLVAASGANEGTQCLAYNEAAAQRMVDMYLDYDDNGSEGPSITTGFVTLRFALKWVSGRFELTFGTLTDNRYRPFSLHVTDLGDIVRRDAVGVFVDTGLNATSGVWQDYTVVVDMAARTFTVSLDGGDGVTLSFFSSYLDGYSVGRMEMYNYGEAGEWYFDSQLQPEPEIEVYGGSPSTLIPTGEAANATYGTAFGNVEIGSSSTPSTIWIVNTSAATAALEVGAISLGAGTHFSQSGLALPASVPVGGSVDFTVTFTPLSVGPLSDTLTITSNDPLTPAYTFTVDGTGVSPATPATVIRFK